MNKIGIDLGGTKIEGIVLDAFGKEIIRKRIDTEQDQGYDHIISQIDTLYQDLLQTTKGKPHTLGIGTPGAISRSGLMKNSNTTCLNGRPFKADLENKLGRVVEIQNDANCFAMAEAMLGAGKGKNIVFGVIMGTGCGGGIIINGKVHVGIQKIGGEWGHSVLDPSGPACYCGKNGCVETFISGTGVERNYFELTGEKKPLHEIAQLAENNDELATIVLDKFYDHFGLAISNLINILDPDVVVLGGGVSNIDQIYTKGIDKIRKYIFNDELLTPVLKHKCGDSAGVIGAAFVGI